MKMRRLNLGCGRDVREGWINLDLVLLPGISLTANIERALPFAKDSFDEILCEHVLEHVDDLLSLLAELHRITRPGGVVRISVPHFSFVSAYTDPTHRRFFGYHTFDYFTGGGTYNFYSNMRFDIRHRRLKFYWIKNEGRVIPSRFLTWLINLWPLLYERFLCWILPVNEVYFELSPLD